MRTFHVCAGLLAIAAGAVALLATKGSRLHRNSGMVFVVAILAMTSSAYLMAAFLRPNRLNVVASLVTGYLVATALLAVRCRPERMRARSLGLMLVALMTSAYAFGLCIEAGLRQDGRIDGMPQQPLYAFGVLALVAAAGDARLLISGPGQPAGRLVRHLWRMCVALSIATASFFLGQAKLFPEPLRKSGLLVLPVLGVFAAMLYWMVRTRLARRRGQPLPGQRPAKRRAVRRGDCTTGSALP